MKPGSGGMPNSVAKSSVENVGITAPASTPPRSGTTNALLNGSSGMTTTILSRHGPSLISADSRSALVQRSAWTRNRSSSARRFAG